MRFQVLNRDEVEKFVTKEKHVVISIYDPERNPPKLLDQKSRKNTLFLSFHDIDKPIFHQVYFVQQHALMIISFYKQWKNKVDLFVISCEAGISRSPAIAAALSMIHGDSDQKFFDFYIPNKHVYKAILDTWYYTEKGYNENW